MWTYSELYSLPLVILLGKFKHHELHGYMTLPALNLRLNILKTPDKKQRRVSNIIVKSWLNCMSTIGDYIVEGKIEGLGELEEVIVKTMFYGGTGIYVVSSSGIDALSLDYVNTGKLYFYLYPREISWSIPSYDLDDLVLLQYALRKGDFALLSSICREGGSSECIFVTSHGLLRVMKTPQSEQGWLRIIPDNNPFRHVVKYEY